MSLTFVFVFFVFLLLKIDSDGFTPFHVAAKHGQVRWNEDEKAKEQEGVEERKREMENVSSSCNTLCPSLSQIAVLDLLLTHASSPKASKVSSGRTERDASGR